MEIKNIIVGAVAALSLSVASHSMAEGGYIGAQYAQVKYDQTNTGINNGDATPTALVITGGYNFSDHIALEGRLGFGLGDDAFSSTVDVDIDSLVSVLGKFSLGGSISPYLLAGFSDVELEATGNQSTEGDGFSFGAGVDFDVSENSAVSLEYIQYVDADIRNGGEAKVTALSLGYNYSF